MRIRIRRFTSMRFPIRLFTSTRIQIQLPTMMPIRTYLFIAMRNPDPAYQNNADPEYNFFFTLTPEVAVAVSPLMFLASTVSLSRSAQ
jgi:hypothetical protein